MGWATEQAQRIAEAEQREETRRRWQLHVASVIENEGPGFFDRLVGQIRVYVEEFNAARGETALTLDGSPFSLMVTKPSYPTICVRLQRAGGFVQYQQREVSQSGNVNVSEHRMDFSVSSADSSLLLGGRNHDDAAREVLERVFATFRK